MIVGSIVATVQMVEITDTNGKNLNYLFYASFCIVLITRAIQMEWSRDIMNLSSEIIARMAIFLDEV